MTFKNDCGNYLTQVRNLECMGKINYKFYNKDTLNST